LPPEPIRCTWQTTAVAEIEAGPGVPKDDATRGLERVIFFSDAVMAIALTLLAISLPVPPGGLTDAGVWHAIGGFLRQGYLTFVITFVVIAAFWINHHRLFENIQRINLGLIRINMVFLFAIVIMPYATRLFSEKGTGQAGTVLYAAAVALVGLSLLGVAWQAHRTTLFGPMAGERESLDTVRALAIPTTAFLISIPLAFISTSVAEWSWLVISVLMIGVVRGLRRRSRRRALGEPPA
jgi:uncharacterized membrane protein